MLCSRKYPHQKSTRPFFCLLFEFPRPPSFRPFFPHCCRSTVWISNFLVSEVSGLLFPLSVRALLLGESLHPPCPFDTPISPHRSCLFQDAITPRFLVNRWRHLSCIGPAHLFLFFSLPAPFLCVLRRNPLPSSHKSPIEVLHISLGPFPFCGDFLDGTSLSVSSSSGTTSPDCC